MDGEFSLHACFGDALHVIVVTLLAVTHLSTPIMLFRITTLLFLASTASGASIRGLEALKTLEDEPQLLEFESWTIEHGKEYSNEEETLDRYLIWKRNDGTL